MITCVCMNPSIDKTIELDGFVYGGLNRIQRSIIDASGKAVNVAIVLRRLGDDSRMLAINYKDGGAALERRMIAENIKSEFVWADGALRVNIKALDTKTGRITEINDRGLAVSSEVVDEMTSRIDAACEGSDYVALTGSLPPGISADLYKTVIDRNRAKCRFVLDCDGEKLSEGIKAKPFLIKPNRFELGLLCGKEPQTMAETARVARQIVDAGVQYVAVSMGGDGALIVGTDEAYFAPNIDVPVRSTVGAGDSMVAGLIHGFALGGGAAEALRWGAACGNASVMTEGTGLIDVRALPDIYEAVKTTKIEF